MGPSVCARCCGFMVFEDFGECRRERGKPERWGFRCINCGAIEDPVIRTNRSRPSTIIMKHARLPTKVTRIERAMVAAGSTHAGRRKGQHASAQT